MSTIVRVHDLPWNGLGSDVSEARGIEDLRQKADLDWEVDRVPVFVANPPVVADEAVDYYLREIPNRTAIVRTDTGQPLGVAGNYFRPIQNADSDWLIEGLWETGNLVPARAGWIKGGQQTFLVGRMGDEWQVGGIDPMDTFFLLSNRHDGRGALQAAVLLIRRGCANELPGIVSGIASGGILRSKSQNRQKLFRWTIRHTTNVAARFAVVREAITTAGQAQEQMKAVATSLLLRPFGTDDMAKVAEKLFPIRGDTLGPRTITKNTARQDELVALYRQADNLEEVRGTAWGGWNAVAEYADHLLAFRSTKVSTKAESRFLSIVDPHGSAHVLKGKAFAAVAQTVGVGSSN